MGRLRAIFMGNDGRPRSGWGLAAFALTAAVVSGLLYLLGRALHLPQPEEVTALDDPRLLFNGALEIASLLAATWAGCRLVRQPVGAAYLRDARAPMRALAGLGLGAVLIALAAALPWLAGRQAFSPSGIPVGALARAGGMQLLLLVWFAAGEELMFRGFVLQQLARGTGRVAAVILTSALFATAHTGNPEVGWAAAINIALVGVLFAVLTLRTGSLWLSAGAHLGWNFCQGFVWGAPVSGYPAGPSLLRRHDVLDVRWSGGEFGFEASLVTTAVLAAAIAVALGARRRRTAR